MKTSELFSAATAVVAGVAVAASLPYASALTKTPIGDRVFEFEQDGERSLMIGDGLFKKIIQKFKSTDEEEDRTLMTVTISFEECVGKTPKECEEIVKSEFTRDPAPFVAKSLDDFKFETRDIRNGTDGTSNLVGLRTNQEETHVVGVLGDGMVFYPWQWCSMLEGVESCNTIGPWDCELGQPLSISECCNLIKASTPGANVNGEYLDCYADPPIGSVSNPIDFHRVIMKTNRNGIIVFPPKNE